MDSISKFFLKRDSYCANAQRVVKRLREEETQLVTLTRVVSDGIEGEEGLRRINESEQVEFGAFLPCQPDSAFDDIDGTDQRIINASSFQILMQIAFAFMCFGDTGSDLFTIYIYATDYDFWFSLFTLIIVLIAGISIIGINMFCYYNEYVKLEREMPTDRRQPPCIWFLRILCNILLIGPFLRYLETAWYNIKLRQVKDKKERKYYTTRIQMAVETSAFLNLVESYMEAAPQLALQIYIMLNQGEQDLFRWIVQAVSCFFSWLSCANALVSQARAHRAHQTDNTFDYLDLFFMFLWRFLMVGPRILAFSLLASVVPYYIVLSIVLGHWFISTLYATVRRFPTDNNFLCEILFSAVIGFVYIFTDWNTRDGYKRWPYIVYYVIVFAENTSMVAVWFTLTPSTNKWYHLTGLIFVIVGFGMGILFMIFYYLDFKVQNLNCCPKEDNVQRRPQAVVIRKIPRGSAVT